ncbi:hypothetical protein [Methylobacterium sp. SyP6R]|nr:hypothetical protein [Methylobacterium sp. SyP6R]MCF4125216.1 hypothetical protein [Methylobacterium sp. SyP6R]
MAHGPVRCGGALHPGAARRGCPMFDVLMLAVGLGFFALSLGYVAVCERL